MRIDRREYLSIPWISLLLMALGPKATLGDVARLRRR